MSKVPGRPFKPGQSGNPIGSSALARETHEARKNQVELADLLRKFASMSLNEVVAFAQNKDNNALQIGIASVYIHAIKSGDPSRMNLVLDRTYGKMKEQIEHAIVGSVQTQILDTILEIEKANKLEVTNGKSEKSNEETSEKTNEEIDS